MAIPQIMPGVQFGMTPVPGAAPAQPSSMQAFFDNPMTSVAMGLLGGNYGPNSRAAFANAMKGGMLGLQQAGVSQARQAQTQAAQQRAALQQQQLQMAQAAAEREKREEEEMRKWAASRGLDPNMPEWALKAQYQAEVKSQYPNAAQYGTSAHMFRNPNNPNDVIVGQMSTGGGAYTFDAQGNPIPIDPKKYIYHKPLSVQNFGNVMGTVNPVTGQGAPIGGGPAAPPSGQPQAPAQIPPGGDPSMGAFMVPPGAQNVTTHMSPMPGQPAMSPQPGQLPLAPPPAVAPSGMVAGDPTTGRVGTSPDQSPTLKGAQETAKLEAKHAFEMKKAEPKVRRMGLSMRTKNVMLNKSFDQALANTSGWTTGFMGKLGSFVPGSPAFDLQESLKPIIANLGFDKLQDMRDNSPTGGALGQVSERELDLLISAVASLNTAQSEEQFRENLQTVKEHYANYLSAYAAAYQEDYGKPLFPEQAAQNSELEALRKEFGITK